MFRSLILVVSCRSSAVIKMFKHWHCEIVNDLIFRCLSAAKIRTTVKLLLENNPVIPPTGLIYAGQPLCVLVCSASR